MNLRAAWAAFRGVQVKTSATAPYVMLQFGGNTTSGIWTKRNFAQYSEDAYKRNVVAYKAINTVARGAAFIPLVVKIGDRDAPDTHPLVKLLKKPNPWQGGASWMEAVVAYYMLSGNSYIEGVGPDGAPPLELYALRPDRMRVLPGKLGVSGYLYEVNGQKKTWDADPITGLSQILHMKTFNPLDDFYGMSPVEAAAYAVDQHNMAGEWNQALLQNAARPSGALVYASPNGGQLSEKQFERLKEELNSSYSGSRNSGRPMILEGGLDWKQMSMTPAEMDWINGKHVSAREIALAFGVPPQVLGIPGDATYSNYQEARQSLYEDTIIPVLDSLLDGFNCWAGPSFGDAHVEMRVDDIPAMAPKREKRWTMVQNATWMTVNEKREATGFEPVEGPEGDEVMIAAGLIPLKGSMDKPEVDETLPELDADGNPIPPEEEGAEEEPVKPKKPIKE